MIDVGTIDLRAPSILNFLYGSVRSQECTDASCSCTNSNFEFQTAKCD